MSASGHVGSVHYLHRDRKPTQDLETKNLAVLDCPDVFQKRNDGALKLELVLQCFVRGRIFGPKSHDAHGLGPGIEHQLTAFNAQQLKAAKTEFIHRRHEAPFRR